MRGIRAYTNVTDDDWVIADEVEDPMARSKSEQEPEQPAEAPTLEEQKDQFYAEVEKAQDDRPKTTPEQDREAERNQRPYREREEEATLHPIGYPTGGEALPEVQERERRERQASEK